MVAYVKRSPFTVKPSATVAEVPALKASPSGWLAWPSTLQRLSSPIEYTPFTYDELIKACPAALWGPKGLIRSLRMPPGASTASLGMPPVQRLSLWFLL